MILNTTNLREFARQYSPLYETKARTRSFSAIQPSVFLSHKHTDVDYVKQVRAILEHFHKSVYVDWQDPTMQHITNAQTAETIKSNINRCKKFILIATNDAIASKWCNWEVGFADALKYDRGNMALFPIADTSNRWSGNEYLRLYPRIEHYSSYERKWTATGECLEAGFLLYFRTTPLIHLKTG